MELSPLALASLSGAGIVERCRKDVAGHQTLLLSDGGRLIQMHLHLLHLGQHLLLLCGGHGRQRLRLSLYFGRPVLLIHPASLGRLLDGMMTLADLLGATRKETDGEGAKVGILGRVGVENDGHDVALTVVDLLVTELILEDESVKVRAEGEILYEGDKGVYEMRRV